MPRRASDANLFVKFSRRSVLNQAKSYGEIILDNDNKVFSQVEGAGHPVHENVDYILIQIPGDRDNIVERPATSCDKKLLEVGAKMHQNCRVRKGLDDKPMLEECDVHRFYDEWTAFKSGQEEQQIGTDLKGWSAIDPASVEDLAYFKVYTVEQLAELNDSNAGGKFSSLRQRARDFLETAKKGAPTQQMRAELDAKDAQLKALTERLAALEISQAKSGSIPKEVKR